MILAKYTAGKYEFFLKSLEKIVLEYREKGTQEWKHKNYASNISRKKIESDILKISGSSYFKIIINPEGRK